MFRRQYGQIGQQECVGSSDPDNYIFEEMRKPASKITVDVRTPKTKEIFRESQRLSSKTKQAHTWQFNETYVTVNIVNI